MYYWQVIEITLTRLKTYSRPTKKDQNVSTEEWLATKREIAAYVQKHRNIDHFQNHRGKSIYWVTTYHSHPTCLALDIDRPPKFFQ